MDGEKGKKLQGTALRRIVSLFLGFVAFISGIISWMFTDKTSTI